MNYKRKMFKTQSVKILKHITRMVEGADVNKMVSPYLTYYKPFGAWPTKKFDIEEYENEVIERVSHFPKEYRSEILGKYSKIKQGYSEHFNSAPIRPDNVYIARIDDPNNLFSPHKIHRWIGTSMKITIPLSLYLGHGSYIPYDSVISFTLFDMWPCSVPITAAYLSLVDRFSGSYYIGELMFQIDDCIDKIDKKVRLDKVKNKMEKSVNELVNKRGDYEDWIVGPRSLDRH